MATARPPRTVDRLGVADALREIGELLALEGASPFKSRAFERGARAVESVPDLASLAADGRLQEVPGIGPVLAATIEELLENGESGLLGELRGRLPPGVVELSSVVSLSRARRLHEDLGIGTLAELEAACRAGRVRGVRGFGEKTEARLLGELRALSERGHALLLHRADAEAERVAAFARGLPGVERVEIAGVLRRRHETVDRLEVVAASRDPARALDRAAGLPQGRGVLKRDAQSITFLLAGDVTVTLRVVGLDAFAGAWLWHTGAEAHVRQLAARAEARGLRLGPQGLGGIDAPDEAALYAALGLPDIPPELREGEGEIAAAERGELPPLVTRADILGAVHCHTDASDGRHDLLRMARAADVLGLRYLTVTDHSQNARYANGLDPERLKRQWDEIARVQEQVTVRLLRGTECDILRDGALDCPAAVIEQLDVVIASVHERYRMTSDEMTDRLVTAMRQPWFKIWGHALGRYVLRRPPVACDLDRVLDAVAGSRAAIEINGDPHRLDLEPRLVREARLRGIRFVVSCDAHSTASLDNIRFGVDMARRAGLTRADVLNTMDTDAFRAEVRPA
ncbi:MAG: helix-hairpin-helix domain-containing protein [Vicinamibacteria bacterium]